MFVGSLNFGDIMDYIKNIINLFNEIILNSLKFEPVILLFLGVIVVCMVFHIAEMFIKGKYKRS